MATFHNAVLAIIPAFNEEECLEDTVNELMNKAPNIDFVVVNDGSLDKTGDICRKNHYPMIDMPINCGLTAGFQAGMKYALRHDYQYAVQFDADGQHRPEFIRDLLVCMEDSSAGIVIGSRFVANSKKLSIRMLGSVLITGLIKITTGQTVRDPTSGFRMFNREMINRYAFDNMLNPEPESIAFLIRKGVKVEEVQVEMRERQAGESYLNLTKSVGYMLRAITSILFVQWVRR